MTKARSKTFDVMWRCHHKRQLQKQLNDYFHNKKLSSTNNQYISEDPFKFEFIKHISLLKRVRIGRPGYLQRTILS